MSSAGLLQHGALGILQRGYAGLQAAMARKAMMLLSGRDGTPGGDHAVPAIQAANLLRLRKRHLLPLRGGLLQGCPRLLRALLHSMAPSVTRQQRIWGKVALAA